MLSSVSVDDKFLKALALGGIVGGLISYQILKMRGGVMGEVRSTTASGSTVYESSRAVDEYLQFHFASETELAPLVGKFLSKEVLQFPQRCPRLLLQNPARHHGDGSMQGTASIMQIQSRSDDCAHLTSTCVPELLVGKQCSVSATSKGRALDIGCAVGGSAFELARDFQEVVAFDFSAAFIKAANTMKDKGQAVYSRTVEGKIMESKTAKVPPGIDRGRVKFIVGDACNMPALKLGKFDAVMAANLLCRVPDPAKFLRDVHDIVKPGGVFVLVSPFSWLTEYTKKDKWLGGYSDESGKPVWSEEMVKNALSDGFTLESTKQMPFLIREHQRKNQIGVSCCQVWRRKA